MVHKTNVCTSKKKKRKNVKASSTECGKVLTSITSSDLLSLDNSR